MFSNKPTKSHSALPSKYPIPLTDPVLYLSFANLPELDDIDTRYWDLHYNPNKAIVNKFFTLSGEIIMNTERHIYIKTPANEYGVHIGLYPNEEHCFKTIQDKKHFDEQVSRFEPGNTIFFSQPQQKIFLDRTPGVRFEDHSFYVFKTSYINCAQQARRTLHNLDAKHDDALSEQICLSCGNPPQPVDSDTCQSKFKSCGKCLVARYCSKKCQVEDWNKKHKFLCQDMHFLLFWAMIPRLNTLLLPQFCKDPYPSPYNEPLLRRMKQRPSPYIPFDGVVHKRYIYDIAHDKIEYQSVEKNQGTRAEREHTLNHYNGSMRHQNLVSDPNSTNCSQM